MAFSIDLDMGGDEAVEPFIAKHQCWGKLLVAHGPSGGAPIWRVYAVSVDHLFRLLREYCGDDLEQVEDDFLPLIEHA